MKDEITAVNPLQIIIGRKWPTVGERMIKSALAVFLCLLIYMARGGSGTPFYATIAAVLCMQPYVGSAKETAFKRVFGTLMGAFYGGIAIYLQNLFLGEHLLLRYMLISAMIIAVIYTTLLFKRPAVAYFSCVVFLSITVVHITDSSPFMFVMNRVADTLVGIFVSLAVNAFRLPRRRNKDLLFISGLDDTLLTSTDNLTPYSKVELNRMIDDGANFTIATERTPASLVEVVKDIRIKLPVIAMNGAALYDMEQNEFIKVRSMDWGLVKVVTKFLEKEGIHYFANVITDNVVLIYFNKFRNEAEQDIYASLKRSPYRNFIHHPLREGQEIAYFMLIEKEERIKELAAQMEAEPWFSGLRVCVQEAAEYPGYAYLKIYRRDATKQAMIEELKQMVGARETITFGSVKGAYDFVVDGGDTNVVVKTIKRLYEPVIWSKKKTT